MKCQQFFFVLLILGLTMASEKSLKVSQGNSHFTKNLYEILSKEEGNVFFSPISVHTILSLVSQGSAKDTLAAFNYVLNVTHDVARDGYKDVMTTLNNVKDVKLHIANKVYVKDSYKLKEGFKSVATQNYLSEVEGVNFEENEKAAKSINSWVEGKTNNKIHDLISKDDLDSLTRMVLVNAIYFKGDWLHQFPKENTKKDKFYTSETDSVIVDMMYQSDKFNYAEIDELDAQVLELKYKNEDVSMFIILPKERTGIKKLEEKLKDYDLSTIRQKLYRTEVKVWLPKFKVETTMELNEPLKKMGLANIFESPDLSGLLESPEPLAVSKVIQKAFIEVNEEGAEAAAATGMVMMARCMPIPRPEIKFVVDHPFITYLVHLTDDDHRTLFMGKIINI